MDDDEKSRTERFFGRCTPDQKRNWERAARQAKRTLSDWLRIIADEAAEQALADQGKGKRK
ncbi:type II toxin -antitoxin system TacA 1-like antitoxin [Planctomicrobium sp. SH664]|uniref:type II toxin -antitoxin system TacA 1-like antitoxin n=1 Tax=Planctomicrobium sp. SH664 TaxID=3448125 RepID=UPI003F5BD5E3